MLFLFSNLPSIHKIDAPTIRNCERLCAEFQHFIIRSQSLKKCFLSIKGIYYQAEIMGEKVTWIVPYKFSQHVTPPSSHCLGYPVVHLSSPVLEDWGAIGFEEDGLIGRFRVMSISGLC